MKAREIKKMNRNDFLDFFLEKVIDVLPPDCKEVQLDIHEVRKATESYTGIIIHHQNYFAGPVLNLEPVLELFEKGMPPHEIAERYASATAKVISEMYRDKSYNRFEGVDKWVNIYDLAKSHLFIRLSNYEKNEEFFKTVPYQMFADLAVTCHLLVDKNEQGMASATVTKTMLDQFQIPEEQLFMDAIENSQKLFPADVQLLADVLGMKNDHGNKMTVISNNVHINGAAAILYPEVQNKLSRLMGDYYILPSSIHEVIALPDDGTINCKDLLQTVKTANQFQVDRSDILSDHVYTYNSEDKTVDVITAEMVFGEYEPKKNIYKGRKH